MTNLEKLDSAAEIGRRATDRAAKIILYAKTKSDEKEQKALLQISALLFEQSYMIDDLLEMINILRLERSDK